MSWLAWLRAISNKRAIEHIVWRYAKYEPENFKLLEVRYNVIKSLILSDCDHLIKFILFGDEATVENKNGCGCNEKGKEKNEKEKRLDIRHIPCNKLWPGKIFLYDDDLHFDDDDNEIKDNEKIKPRNNMELAIYHCNGRSLN